LEAGALVFELEGTLPAGEVAVGNRHAEAKELLEEKVLPSLKDAFENLDADCHAYIRRSSPDRAQRSAPHARLTTRPINSARPFNSALPRCPFRGSSPLS
jgi:hypothetical protein